VDCDDYQNLVLQLPSKVTAVAEPSAPWTTASIPRLLIRGATRRCARCGARRLFTRWFKMVDRCPRCGYLFAREEGFFLGAFVINFGITIAGIGVVMGILIAVLAGGGSSRAIATVALAAVAVAVILPIVFYPFSKTIWTAIDLAMHGGNTGAGDSNGIRRGYGGET
jgi:uncharacterized protein (DUF983 family)